MSKTLYTDKGLVKLAAIVRQARGSLSFRKFEDLTDVSHATIRRLENHEVKNPEDSTLMQIATHTPYSYEELKAIAQERNTNKIRNYLVAEDIFPSTNELPEKEAARLAQMIVGRLAGI